MTNMDKVEVGGDHYNSSAIEPIEYIRANGLDFFEGNIIKYVTRHRKKNGKEDIMKVIQYAMFILDYEYKEKTKLVNIDDKVIATSK